MSSNRTARPTGPTARPRRASVAVPGLIAGALVLSAALAGCSGDDSPAPADSTTSASATSTLAVPAGVTLTEDGTALKVGQKATVAYKVTQKKVGVLTITVKSLRRTTFARSFSGWRLPASVKKSRPYFVTATFKNRGTTSLAGERPPLYVTDADGVLVESSQFASSFTPCPSTSFPSTFKPGATVTTCLVYLVPDGGTLENVAFRPTQDVAGLTWTGKVVAVGEKNKLKKKQKKG
ncbi:hypothetical protein [Nocardioides sp. GY 10127]|uniref:hypothetical protein n=1 Tax=Nocardioides sp. GY 10127 TaxID=2569762 RepID=UPI0010A79F7A|nr:hypothetical protein [Nocardioides sp. GY 10127]TIC83957.1 hypothetical protein E8D37_03845 [Nocardioides sp. GY 10127]